MYPLKQSTAIDVLLFAHDVNGDAVTGKVDGDFTKRISKAGAAFAAMTVIVTERENGWYVITLSAGHTDTLGILSLTFTASGIKQVNMQYRVHVRVPDDLAFPATTGRSIQVETDGMIHADVKEWLAAAPNALIAGRVDGSVGAMAAAVLTAAAIATDAITAAKIAANAITAAKIAAAAITVTQAPTLDAAMSTRATPAQVNSEVSDVLKTDTVAERSQGLPPTTPTMEAILSYLYMALTKKVDVTSGFKEIHDNADVVIAKKALSDDGTTYSEAKMETGP